MNKKELKEKVILLLEAHDEESVLDTLYIAAMTYGELDNDLLDEATPGQVRRLQETIRRAEARDLVPGDEEMNQVRLLTSNYFAAFEEEPEPAVSEEPKGRYRSSERDILDDLTPEQLEHLEESRRQIARGEFYTHEEVQQKVREWLAK